MKYPIIAEEYIAAMKAEYGTTPEAERGYYALVPLVNSAYQRGRDNAPGYPMNPAEIVAEFEAATGPAPAVGHLVVSSLIVWMNKAYERGQNDAKGAML